MPREAGTIVTGPSSGIGYELGECCAENGCDLLAAADEPEIDPACKRCARSASKSTRCRPISPPTRALKNCMPPSKAARSVRCWRTPGETDTEFFEHADMMDTKVGTKKADPADVAKAGLGDVVAGWKNKLQAAMANVTPASMLTEQHRKLAQPGTAEK